MYLGNFEIDDVVTLSVVTTDPATGGNADATGSPAYRVYEDETTTAILTGSLAKLDDANTLGFYSEQLTLSAANGFEAGKSYNIYISATVVGVAGATRHFLTVGVGASPVAIREEMDSNSNKLSAIEADTDELQQIDHPTFAEVKTQCAAALVDIKLDHLLAVADADDVVDDSVIAKMASKTGDWSLFVMSTDSLQGIRDEGDLSWNTTAPDPMRLLTTTVATVIDTDEFTLTDGPDFDNAYNGQTIVFYDASNNDYQSIRTIVTWTGATKTALLDSATDFTVAVTDVCDVFATAPGSTAPTAGQIRIEMDNNSSKLAAIVADTNEMQQDLINGGRLDLLIDAILADTNELQVDLVNGGRLDLLIDQILADTNEMQLDLVNGGRLDLLIDAILADTGELQTDLVNGGRLDLLIDAIKAKSDLLTFTGGLLQGEVNDITATALAKYVTEDTGETTATAGSVAQLSQGTGTAVVGITASTEVFNTSTLEITFVRGDDYLLANNRQIDILLDDTTNITVGVATAFFRGSDGALVTFVAGSASIVNITGDLYLRIQSTRAQTAAVAAGSYNWDAEIRDDSGYVRTRISGILTLNESWTAIIA